MKKDDLEIRLLENSFELSKSNYHLWATFYLTTVAIIFVIIQIMIEIFPENRISIFVGGIIAYIILSFIWGSKLYYEMRKSNVKYELIKRK